MAPAEMGAARRGPKCLGSINVQLIFFHEILINNNVLIMYLIDINVLGPAKLLLADGCYLLIK